MIDNSPPWKNGCQLLKLTECTYSGLLNVTGQSAKEKRGMKNVEARKGVWASNAPNHISQHECNCIWEAALTGIVRYCWTTSYHNVQEEWVPELKSCMPHVPYILIGTQIDLRDDPKTLARLLQMKEKPLTYEQGLKLAREIGAQCYLECSALTQKGLKTVFDEAILTIFSPKKQKRGCAACRSCCAIV
ncbi:rho-related GTP-binding [Labeo rohita]|uniref:Rho-related GTP-binding n=1 Tax=Labeo rohita TaxID=84645 RepID=A0A498MH34_LABRO|nr:rho-related GTP-binding [Labeo rohita]